jgi:hypothetical protein
MFEIRELTGLEYDPTYATKPGAGATDGGGPAEQPTVERRSSAELLSGHAGELSPTSAIPLRAGWRRGRYPRQLPWLIRSRSPSPTVPSRGARGSTAADLAASIGPRLAKAAVIAVVDGVERDLVHPVLHDGAEVEIVTPETDRGLYTIRHSTAHVLAQAVLDLFPGATFAIGPPVQDGFYYDFELPDGGTFASRRPRAHRGPDARDHRREAAVHPRRDPRGRGARAVPRPPLQVRDHPRRGRGPDVGHRDRPGPHLREPAQLHRPVPRPPRAPHRSARPLQADAGGRRLLAGRRDQADAPAHLRHRLGHQGRAAAHLDRLEEAEKRDHRKLGRRARPVQLPRRDRLGPGGVPPQGRHRPPGHGGLLAAATRRPATSSSTRPTSPRAGCSRPRGTSSGTPTACSRRCTSTTTDGQRAEGVPTTTSSR